MVFDFRGRSQTTFTRLTFCKLSYHRKCKRRGVGGQKKPNFVNIVCERPLVYMYAFLAQRGGISQIFFLSLA